MTFTLEPQRSRVVAAKFLAGISLAATVMVLASLIAAVFTALAAATGASPEWSVDGNLLFNGFVLANLIGIFVGFAIAMLLMNTPGWYRRLLRLQPDPADRGRHPQRAQLRLRQGRPVDRVQHGADPAVHRRLPAVR